MDIWNHFRKRRKKGLLNKNHDVAFLVGNDHSRVFTANRTVLSLQTAMFECLYPELMGRGLDHPVHVEDVTAKAFQILLDHIYEREYSLDLTFIFEVGYAAHKFRLSQLQVTCMIYLRRNITVDNVLTVFVHASPRIPSMICECMNFMFRHGDEIINKECIRNMNLLDFLNFIGSDRLSVSSEISVFRAVLRWATGRPSSDMQ
eukprot:707738_1